MGRRALRLLWIAPGLLGALLLALGVAHLRNGRENPALPGPGEVAALAATHDRPVRLSWIETARQCTPLEQGEACIVHPVFVLEWADGRLLLVDAGMEAEAARAFGRPMEWLLGAKPTVPGRAVASALGRSRDRVGGLVFTHLHNDHTQGIAGLCALDAPPLPIFQTPAQARRGNYTVAMGERDLEEAGCALSRPLADEGLALLPGFPGVAVVRAAGHTPGSQMVLAWVGPDPPRGFALVGDVVFDKAHLDEDRAKHWAYRTFVTPENAAQLRRVRAWLRALAQDHGVTAIPSHDRAWLVGLGLPRTGS
jgi:glyoxylase-like metal-dependent hydrolase (beta-lactamase superfamily II)